MTATLASTATPPTEADDVNATTDPGWTFVTGPDGIGSTNATGDLLSTQHVTGNAGSRLVSFLEPAIDKATLHLRAQVLVRSGQVLLSAADGAAASLSLLLGAAPQWQTVDRDVPGPADQIVIYLAEEGTDVSIRSVSCTAAEAIPAGGTERAASDPEPTALVVNALHHNVPGSAYFDDVAGPLPVGTPVTLHGTLNPGVVWTSEYDPTHKPPITWDTEPAVVFDGTISVTVDTGETAIASLSGQDSFSVTVTFAENALHTLTARIGAGATTFTPAIIVAGPVDVTVNAPSSIDLHAGGSAVPVTVQALPAGWFDQVSAAPDTSPSTTIPLTKNGTATWSGGVPLSENPIGARSITITAASSRGPNVTQVITLTGRDVTAPTVTVPASGQVSDDGTVTISGTASDVQNGVAGGQSNVSVQVLPAGPNAVMTPTITGDWSSWTASFTPTSTGPASLKITACDAGGVSAATVVNFDIVSSYTPQTLDERLSPLEYLRAVMSFANFFVNTAAAEPVAAVDLADALSQPLERMSEPLTDGATAAQLPINELRVPVELLRAHITAHSLSSDPGATAEQAYRLAAYQALLIGAGTSYDELRLNRTAADADRGALAARMGIPLYGTTSAAARPDQLDALTIPPDDITEASLEQLFGLPDTTAADTLRVAQPSQFALWRQESLRATWRQQDKNPPVPLAYGALVDPDLISAADIAATNPDATSITTLLTQRASDLNDVAGAVAGAIAGGADTAGKLAAATAAGWPTAAVTWLADLISAEATGTDIADQLTNAGLDRAGFAYLSQLHDLAAAGLVTGQEWDGVTDVLVGAYRRRQYQTWLPAEDAVILSPGSFVDSGAAPARTALRIDPQARLAWVATLANRIAQAQSGDDAVAAIVSSAEQSTLPMLRDALLSDIAPSLTADPANPAATTDPGERMTERYGIDMRAGGTIETTRLAQATASAQALLELVRSGDVGADSPAQAWVPQPHADGQPTFDQAWTIVGDYLSWKQAATAFLFPEQHLDPAQLAPTTYPAGDQSAAFDTLCSIVASTLDLTPTAAENAMADYARAVQGSAGLPAGDHLTWLNDRNSAWQQTLANASAAIPAPTPAAPTQWAREIYWAAPMLVAQRLQAAGEYQAALDWYWTALPYNTAAPISAYSVLNAELAEPPARPTVNFDKTWTVRLNPFSLILDRPAPYLRATLLAIIGCLLDYADAEFTTEDDDALAHARALYLTATGLASHHQLAPVDVSDDSPGEGSYPLPLLAILSGRAANQLAKLRQGRNIAGLPRQSISLGSAAGIERQPTPYHYATLFSRAQQLTQQAAQMEATYLSLLEKYDTKQLQVQQAAQAVGTATMQEQVSADQVQQATDGKATADAQVNKAAAAITMYQQSIAAPANQYEQELLQQYGSMRDLQDTLAVADTAVGVAQAATSAAGGAAGSMGASIVLGTAQGVATVVRGGAQMAINDLSAQMQANQLQSNIEERVQQWQQQLAVAEQDQTVALTQQQTARDQVTIAVAEQSLTAQQSANASATLALLQSQFTSPDLYQLMSTNVGATYRSILQQATATARLAQAQLAFERVATSRSFIATDYWQTPGALHVAGQDTSRGMTGAERLTADLAQLDSYAFTTDTRTLNISQTFSLAELLPVEFIAFRRTGQLPFATPMSWFTSSFPAVYRCLISQVTVNVVALVPPTRGIRATLSNNGISRVTTQQDGGGFVDLILRRDPNEIAFTSAIGATGMFAVDKQATLLLPFEGIGVDTSWQLALPPAANPFDFANISDVLITIDYTAMSDAGLASQVIKSMNGDRTMGGDVAFSLARDYPDQFYTLCNPASDQPGPSADLLIRSVDLPPWATDLHTANVAVQVTSSAPLDSIDATLTRSPAPGVTIGGAARLGPSGIASTRRSAGAWSALQGPDPTGQWTIGFDSGFVDLVASGLIDDVVILISWTGQGPAWNE